MMIQLKCPHCGKDMRAGDEHAGKKVRCPGCKEVVTLPAATTAVKAAPPAAPTPIRKAGPPPVPKRRPARDEEDEPVEMTGAEDESDEDEEEEDRPRRKRAKKKRRRGEYENCPECDSPGFATKVGFTWWGGVLGPWMLTHVRCNECGTCYNGRTGKSNTTAIVIYTVVGALLGLFVVGMGLISAIATGGRH